MYAYIDAEKWDADARPELAERHGSLFGTGDFELYCYGFLIEDKDELDAITLARGQYHMRKDQLPLPF